MTHIYITRPQWIKYGKTKNINMRHLIMLINWTWHSGISQYIVDYSYSMLSESWSFYRSTSTVDACMYKHVYDMSQCLLIHNHHDHVLGCFVVVPQLLVYPYPPRMFILQPRRIWATRSHMHTKKSTYKTQQNRMHSSWIYYRLVSKYKHCSHC